jgi:hypothetical protein
MLNKYPISLLVLVWFELIIFSLPNLSLTEWRSLMRSLPCAGTAQHELGIGGKKFRVT